MERGEKCGLKEGGRDGWTKKDEGSRWGGKQK